MTLAHESPRYTYDDYCKWDDDERWELIEGVPYAMSPAPGQKHQSAIVEFAGQLRDFLKGKPCKLYVAPFDVRLNADDGDDTVVQPDLLVVCDGSKLDGKGCVGAPDMVIEILSPSTARRDRLTKFRLYQEAGVGEYWIVDPDSKTVQAHVLHDGKYDFTMYADAAPVTVLSGCTIELKDVFEE